MTTTLTRSYIGIGSNLDQPINNVLRAFSELGSIGQVSARSSLYRTKPWGYTEQPDFINAVAALEVNYSPQQLLQSLLDIEQKMGRERLIKWGPRIIDLDILLFGELKISQPSLTIPHPHMYERAFVLVPLAELNPDFCAAVSNLPAGELEQITLIKNLQVHVE
jgi:2-amino-4-hydroxy-6-hydroxymethyldihydropteridine diphosphokinase